MRLVSAETLTELGLRILARAGAPHDVARSVVASLVRSSLEGHDSHGVMRLIDYVGKIRSGHLVPDGRAKVLSVTGAAGLVDGGWGFGPPVARFGADLAADIARRENVGCVALRQVNHIGRLGDYADQLAREGLIGIVMTSGAMYGGSVAPYGGREAVFGTNPIAFGVPTGDEPPTTLVTDFATSAVSIGKILVALANGERIAPGLLLDAAGQGTTDPKDVMQGGVLLPFGGYKGYGLMLMMEIIPTLLAGFAPASSAEYQPGNPTLILALRIEAFVERSRFYRLVRELLSRVKEVAPLDGMDPVLLPGDVERAEAEVRTANGVPIPEATWASLQDLAEG